MIFVMSMENELNMDASFKISDQERLGTVRPLDRKTVRSRILIDYIS